MVVTVHRAYNSAITMAVDFTYVVGGKKHSHLCYLTEAEFDELLFSELILEDSYYGNTLTSDGTDGKEAELVYYAKLRELEQDFLDHCDGYYDHFHRITGGSMCISVTKTVMINCDKIWENVMNSVHFC